MEPFEFTKENRETIMQNLHKPLTDLQIKLDSGTDLETALYEVECLHQLDRQSILYMGFVYIEWKFEMGGESFLKCHVCGGDIAPEYLARFSDDILNCESIKKAEGDNG